MEIRFGSYLTILLEELAGLSNETLGLFRSVRLQSRHVDENDKKVKITTLNPNARLSAGGQKQPGGQNEKQPF